MNKICIKQPVFSLLIATVILGTSLFFSANKATADHQSFNHYHYWGTSASGNVYIYNYNPDGCSGIVQTWLAHYNIYEIYYHEYEPWYFGHDYIGESYTGNDYWEQIVDSFVGSEYFNHC
jgi:hypothetical protein